MIDGKTTSAEQRSDMEISGIIRSLPRTSPSGDLALRINAAIIQAEPLRLRRAKRRALWTMISACSLMLLSGVAAILWIFKENGFRLNATDKPGTEFNIVLPDFSSTVGNNPAFSVYVLAGCVFLLLTTLELLLRKQYDKN